jgi:uncharacterized protein YggL (DUF469 family)
MIDPKKVTNHKRIEELFAELYDRLSDPNTESPYGGDVEDASGFIAQAQASYLGEEYESA